MNPVLQAVMRGDTTALRTVLEAGEHPDARDRDGATPLMQAVVQGDIAAVRILIELGADVRAHNKEGWTPLHFAAQEFRIDIAEVLLRRGAVLDAQDSHGNSPLWRAVFNSRGRGEMIRLLVDAGADVHLKNKHGVSPEDLAARIANYDLRQYLG